MKITPQIYLLRVLILVLMSILLAACGGGGSTDSGGAEEDMLSFEFDSVLVIGDSISTGATLATPWPDRLANLLSLPVDNSFSMISEQTSYGVSIIDSAITSSTPSHVVIFLGSNDALFGSVSNAVSNLQRMVDIANSRDVTVIVATLPLISRSSSGDARARQINDGIRRLSGARIAPVRAAIGNDASLLDDGLHPTNAGQQIIAEAIATVF